MAEKETVQMHINIAGERISLNVDFGSQDDVRDAEQSVCELYSKWKKKFPSRSDHELLAMLSYQFAYYYLVLGKRYKAAGKALEKLDDDLDRLLS